MRFRAALCRTQRLAWRRRTDVAHSRPKASDTAIYWASGWVEFGYSRHRKSERGRGAYLRKLSALCAEAHVEADGPNSLPAEIKSSLHTYIFRLRLNKIQPLPHSRIALQVKPAFICNMGTGV